MADESAGARAIQHDGWGELVLDRPARRNAITGPMVAALRAGLASLTEAGSRVVLLRGEGGAFCSGLDLDAFGADPAPAWRASFQETWSGWHRDLYLSRAVIVGALERFAINGGASMAIACDLLVAGEGATILVGEAAQGMYAPMNTAWLRLKTTEAIAAQLTLAARRIPAADLLRLGLAYEVVADDKVLERAREVAAMLAGYPGQGLAAIKEAMRRPLHGPADGIFEQLRTPAVATSAAPRRVERA
ncbi:MAG TPA: enoyl-CoA hydratase/isomerase family protein [Caulobacteraceae bacterium]|jgi:enoyl-CoA hydratase|nr:enoyl-CoA hydratase/isomerase family protein [Caulobacteraceae bacterium]